MFWNQVKTLLKWGLSIKHGLENWLRITNSKWKLEKCYLTEFYHGIKNLVLIHFLIWAGGDAQNSGNGGGGSGVPIIAKSRGSRDALSVQAHAGAGGAGSVGANGPTTFQKY